MDAKIIKYKIIKRCKKKMYNEYFKVAIKQWHQNKNQWKTENAYEEKAMMICISNFHYIGMLSF